MSEEGESIRKLLSTSKQDLWKFLQTVGTEHDYVSNTSHLHLGFIFKTICESFSGKENETIDDQKLDGIKELLQQKMGLADSGYIDDMLFSGSIAEGLYVPPFIERDNPSVGGYQETLPDIDMMQIIPHIYIRNLSEAHNNSLVFETEGCHEGYTRIGLGSSPPENFSLKYEQHGANYYLSNDVISHRNRKLVEAFSRDDKEHKTFIAKKSVLTHELQTSQHGPALTAEKTFLMWEDKVKIFTDIDSVPALKCEWPGTAQAWRGRQRLAKWPSDDLIQSIMSKGSHVVPTAHSTSMVPGIEWRFSFSEAEVALSRSLTRFQRQCYRLFKMLCKIGIKHTKIIATYHLKTLFFWLCEEMGITFWNPANISFIIITLLDRLTFALGLKCIQNFFIPSNNMIDHIERQNIKHVLKDVLEVRRNPVKFIIEFGEKSLVSSAGLPWRAAFSPVIGHLQIHQCSGKNPDRLVTLSACVKSLQWCGLYHNAWKCYPQALANFNAIADICELLQFGSCLDRFEFISNSSLDLPNLPMTALFRSVHSLIDFHKYILKAVNPSTDYWPIALLQTTLGYLYLVLANMPEPVYRKEWDKTAEVLKRINSEEYAEEYELNKDGHLKEAHACSQIALNNIKHLLDINGKIDEAFPFQIVPRKQKQFEVLINVLITTARVEFFQCRLEASKKNLQLLLQICKEENITVLRKIEARIFQVDFLCDTIISHKTKLKQTLCLEKYNLEVELRSNGLENESKSFDIDKLLKTSDIKISTISFLWYQLFLVETALHEKESGESLTQLGKRQNQFDKYLHSDCLTILKRLKCFGILM